MRTFLITLALFFTAPIYAQDVKVEKTNLLQIPQIMGPLWVAGEIQSAVIPPNTNDQCKEGRLLISNDMRRPNMAGLVSSRRLDALDRRTIDATFDLPMNPGNYAYTSNDHDLVALPNGDVFYVTGAGSKAPLDVKKNPWFNVTRRVFPDGTVFGPGAHGVVMTWRSTDCGRSFQFVSVYDPAMSANADERTCENPSFAATVVKDKSGAVLYDMGGSDGQLVKAFGGQMYMTYRCVGLEQDTTKSGFVLDPNKPLDKTLVAVADKEGNWKTLGVMKNVNWWRLGMARLPFNTNRLAFGLGAYFVIGIQNPWGMTFPPTANPVGPYTYGWDDATFKNNPSAPKKGAPILTNDPVGFRHTIVSRVPGSSLLLIAFPDTFDKLGHGYRVLMYNTETKKYVDLSPVVPRNSSLNNIIFHLTAIDGGQGPVLLYWYDVDMKSKTAAIRGRFITGEKAETEDIDIRDVDSRGSVFSQIPTQGSAAFDLNARPGYWYGDYHTADGYASEPLQDSVAKTITRRYYYFPVWVEPDETIRFTRVEWVNVSAQRREDYHRLTIKLFPERSFKPSPGPVERVNLKFATEGLRREREIHIMPQLRKRGG